MPEQAQTQDLNKGQGVDVQEGGKEDERARQTRPKAGPKEAPQARETEEQKREREEAEAMHERRLAAQAAQQEQDARVGEKVEDSAQRETELQERLAEASMERQDELTSMHEEELAREEEMGGDSLTDTARHALAAHRAQFDNAALGVTLPRPQNPSTGQPVRDMEEANRLDVLRAQAARQSELASQLFTQQFGVSVGAGEQPQVTAEVEQTSDGTDAIACLNCGRSWPYEPRYAGTTMQCLCGTLVAVKGR